MMENEYIYTEASISKSLDGSKWEHDKNGNPIIIIEASNENLDYEGEKVLRSALMNSKDYFLKNGVISYDHKHLPNPDNFNWDPEWNAEKYVLGKPLDAWLATNDKNEKVVRVKAVLSRSNEIAKEIISKLKDGLETVKASVGGRKVSKAMRMCTKSYKDVPTIISVNWNEVALTYKPVNQTLEATTLSPANFVKSLTAGNSANPGDMGSGGNTLQGQSLEGSPIYSLLEKIKNKEISKSCDAISHLVKSGYSEEKAGNVLKLIIDKNILGDVMKTDKDNVDTIDSGTSDLEKALAAIEGGDSMSKGMKDGMYKMKGGHMYMKKADDSYEKVDKDSPDYNGDDDDKDDKDMEKSIDENSYDATADIEEMKKSLKSNGEEIADLKDMVKSLVDGTTTQNTLLKAIGTSAVESDKLIKSIANLPAGRQTGDLNTQDRFKKSLDKSLEGQTEMTIMKSLNDAGVNENMKNQVGIAMRRQGIASLATNAQFASILPIIAKKEA